MAASSSTRQHRTAWFLHLVVDERTPSRLQGVASSIGIERFFGQVLLTLHQVHHADPACRRSCMLFRSIGNDGASCNCCESSHHDSNGSHNDRLAHVFPLPISGPLLTKNERYDRQRGVPIGSNPRNGSAAAHPVDREKYLGPVRKAGTACGGVIRGMPRPAKRLQPRSTCQTPMRYSTRTLAYISSC
jgi:hypothetical protein